MRSSVIRSHLPLSCVLFGALVLSACAQQEQPAPPAPQVVVDTVQRRDLPLKLKYPARVSGSRVVEVRARVSGVIVERAYREGQRVKAGDLLFRIEPDVYRATHEQALADLAMQRAAVAQAHSDFERATALVKEGAVSRRAFDEAQAALLKAEAALAAAEAAEKIARLNLGYTEVRSPVSGLTSKEAVTVGNIVDGSSGAGGDLLTTVVQADPAYVEFSIAEPEHLRVRSLVQAKPGDLPVQIVSGSHCNVVGRMDFSDAFVNPTTGTVRARAIFPNPDGCLVSGQHLSIEMSGLAIQQAIALSKAAVLFTQGGPIVWVVNEDGAVEPRSVQIEESWEDSWVVQGGVQPGERVIVEGVLKVHPGSTVAALTREEAARQAELGASSSKARARS
ncbi:MAG TPA: efflux RND transporter periplasmic adaptor subunit [Steroidobacter sp.]|nr:efflux RND transporter periplasmic adaptor subunit [Steroidobacter sp.]